MTQGSPSSALSPQLRTKERIRFLKKTIDGAVNDAPNSDANSSYAHVTAVTPDQNPIVNPAPTGTVQSPTSSPAPIIDSGLIDDDLPPYPHGAAPPSVAAANLKPKAKNHARSLLGGLRLHDR